MHKWMEEDRKSHGWRHISAFASDEITPTAGSACVVLLNSPRGQLAGVSEHAAYIICAALMKLCELPHRYTSSGVT